MSATSSRQLNRRQLGNGDLQLSEIGLGTMNFGQTVDSASAFAQLDFALERGVNLIDTAETYPFPPNAATHGLSEQMIGHWLRTNGRRDKLILATKVAGPSAHLHYLRGGNSDHGRAHLESAINDSLRRLSTDYLDLAFLHWPARATNSLGQLDYKPAKKEPNQHRVKDAMLCTLEALDDLIRRGKVRYFGVSNETPWGLMQFLRLAEINNLPIATCIQNPYHLLNRSFDIGLAEIADRENIGLIAYSPLAFGLLTDKHHRGSGPQTDTRLVRTQKLHRFLSNSAVSAAKKYHALAQKFDIDVAQLAIAYLLTRRYVSSVLVSASDLSQLANNLDAPNQSLPQDLLSAIEKIHRQSPNPGL